MTDTDSRGYSYSRKCWYCGSFDMENKGDFIQCLDCGATYNEVPTVGDPIVEPGTVISLSNGKPIRRRMQRPTRSVKHRAAKARRLAHA